MNYKHWALAMYIIAEHNIRSNPFGYPEELVEAIAEAEQNQKERGGLYVF
jgi:hypothetical protein